MSKAAKHIARVFAHSFLRAESTHIKAMKRTWRQAKACCVISDSGLGDSIMATPLIKGIRQQRPDMKVVVVCSEVTQQVFAASPNVDKIFSYNTSSPVFISLMQLVCRVRREHVDALFAAQPANVVRHSLLAAMSRARVILKHSYDYGNSLERDFSFVYSVLLPDNMERHRVELNLDFLRYLGEEIHEGSLSPDFLVSRKSEDRVERLLSANKKDGHDCRLVAIHPGGVRPHKRWPPECFAEVAKELMNMGFTVCLIGGSDQIGLSDLVKAQIRDDGVLDVTGQLILEETAAVLKKCRCLISNDTGIMHLSTAVQTPVIAIFGPTDFRHIGPYSPNAEVLFKSENIQSITPSDVLAGFHRLINQDSLTHGTAG